MQKDEESPPPAAPPRSRRSSFASTTTGVSGRDLDRGLDQSLRYMDYRYGEEQHSNDRGDAYHTDHSPSQESFHGYYNNPNDPDNSFNNSGFISTTDLDDDISTTFDGRSFYTRNDNEDYFHHYSQDDPRFQLFHLLDIHCSVTAYDEKAEIHSNNWDPIREWLCALLPNAEDETEASKEEVLRAAVLEGKGRSGQTILHVACERSVPLDVLELLLSVHREETSNLRRKTKRDASSNSYLARQVTIDGWLPLHYACNYPNDYEVVRKLVEIYPEAKTTADLKGRTPLHFAMREENMNRPQVVALLSTAAGIADDNGILPLHYACLYGATEDFLRILTDAYPAGVASKDRFGRVPLHYSLSNAGRPNAPAAVRLLLGLKPDLVNTPGIARMFSGSDAVRKYASFVQHRSTPIQTRGEAQKTSDASSEELFFSNASVEECLKRFLEARPRPTADFFTALQSLPEALREKAVLMREVQELLNQKIGQRFPTALLLLDLYLQILVIVCYTLAIRDSVIGRFHHDDYYTATPWSYLIGVYVGLTYFLFREIVQIIGLLSLKASWIWVYEPGTWLNVLYIGVIGTWTMFMTTGACDRTTFRTGATVSFAVIWLKFLSYLRNILIDFSVFSGGVFHVLRRLLAFLMCLTIILIAFSRMFFTLFYETEYCTSVRSKDVGHGNETELDSSFFFLSSLNDIDDESFTKDLICETNDKVLPWCSSWDSFLAVYTMLLGEVDETVFDNNVIALVLFVVFMLLVVILLANVLIAIVTDSYKVIRDKRAAIVFWTNRLDFIAQMDAIANGPWKIRLKRFLRLDDHEEGGKTGYHQNSLVDVTFGKALWNDVLELFDHNVLAADGLFSWEFVLCTLLRMAAIVLVPLWILGGAIVVGLLWPPQIREKLFVSAISKHSSESEKEEMLRKTQIERLRSEIAILKEDLMRESTQHRTQIIQMKSAVAERKLETLNTLTAIKKNVVLALELCEMGHEEE